MSLAFWHKLSTLWLSLLTSVWCGSVSLSVRSASEPLPCPKRPVLCTSVERRYPSILQTTSPSFWSHESSHTVPQRRSWNTSTRPSWGPEPFTSLTRGSSTVGETHTHTHTHTHKDEQLHKMHKIGHSEFFICVFMCPYFEIWLENTCLHAHRLLFWTNI